MLEITRCYEDMPYTFIFTEFHDGYITSTRRNFILGLMSIFFNTIGRPGFESLKLSSFVEMRKEKEGYQVTWNFNDEVLSTVEIDHYYLTIRNLTKWKRWIERILANDKMHPLTAFPSRDDLLDFLEN